MKNVRPPARRPAVRPPSRPRGALFWARRPPAGPAAPRLWRWPLRFGRLRRAGRRSLAPPAGGPGAGRRSGGPVAEAQRHCPVYTCNRWPRRSGTVRFTTVTPVYICKPTPVYTCKPPLSIAGVNPLAAAVAIAVRLSGNRLTSSEL